MYLVARQSSARTHAWIAHLVRRPQAIHCILSVGPASLYWTRPAATGPKHDNKRCQSLTIEVATDYFVHDISATVARMAALIGTSLSAQCMNHFYRNVIKLGNVAVSRHAQKQMQDNNVPIELFEKALLRPAHPDIPDGQDILWRERDGLRIVILTNPTPNTGAKLIKTVYRIKKQASAKP